MRNLHKVLQSQKRMALSIDEANRAVKRIVESLEVRKLIKLLGKPIN